MVNQKAIGATASPVITLYLAGPLESPRDSERRDFKTDMKLPYKVGFGMGIGSVHLEHNELASFMKGRLSNQEASSVAHHLVSCTECTRELRVIVDLLWPSLSMWSKCWLHIFSFGWLPRPVSTFLGLRPQRSAIR